VGVRQLRSSISEALLEPLGAIYSAVCIKAEGGGAAMTGQSRSNMLLRRLRAMSADWLTQQLCRRFNDRRREEMPWLGITSIKTSARLASVASILLASASRGGRNSTTRLFILFHAHNERLTIDSVESRTSLKRSETQVFVRFYTTISRRALSTTGEISLRRVDEIFPRIRTLVWRNWRRIMMQWLSIVAVQGIYGLRGLL
jgi:hypothetical protein